MNQRLDYFITQDDQARDRVSNRSALIGFVTYLVLIYLDLAHPPQAAIATLIVMGCVFAWHVFVYCRAQEQVPVLRLHFNELPEQPKRRYYAAAGLIIGFIVLLRLRPRLEAAIITDHLDRLAKTPDEHSIRKASSLLSVANSDGLILPVRSIEVLTAKRGGTVEQLRSALNERQETEARKRNLQRPFCGYRVQEVLTESEVGSFSGEFKNFPPEVLKILQHPEGYPVPSDLVAFLAQIGHPFTKPTSEGFSVIAFIGPGHKIHLDGKHCKNVFFKNSKVSYFGGPLIAENVGFVDCTFELRSNLNCQRLAEEILTDPLVTLKIA